MRFAAASPPAARGRGGRGRGKGRGGRGGSRGARTRVPREDTPPSEPEISGESSGTDYKADQVILMRAVTLFCETRHIYPTASAAPTVCNLRAFQVMPTLLTDL